MNNRKFNSLITIVILAVFGLVGCSSEQAAEITPTTESEVGHEGHGHDSGEGHENLLVINDTLSHSQDWCVEHVVPESVCTICNPSLIEGFKESGDWCAGHDLPESHCRLCNPGIVFPQEEALLTRAIDVYDLEIGVSLNFRSNATACATDGALIQFASATTADRAGISIQAIRETEFKTTNDAPAEILFDETETVAITTTVSAMLAQWVVSPGDKVLRGEVLAVLKSPEIARLQSDLVTTYANYEVEQKELARHTEMKKQNLISESDWDQQSAQTEKAYAEYISSRGLLLSAGLIESDISEIIEYKKISNQFALRATADGVVIERIPQLGDLLEAGRAYATIGDPKAMWIEGQLTEEQLREVKPGDQLTFSSDGRGINRVGGEVIWVSNFLDPHTRTGTVRARVLDADHQLHAGEFGRVHIVNHNEGMVSLIPKDAVQWEGCCNVVFVEETAGRYRPRKINLISSDGPYYMVDDGVQVGEKVVVDGAFLLKTELKKTSIGAGCCGLEPVG